MTALGAIDSIDSTDAAEAAEAARKLEMIYGVWGQFHNEKSVTLLCFTSQRLKELLETPPANHEGGAENASRTAGQGSGRQLPKGRHAKHRFNIRCKSHTDASAALTTLASTNTAHQKKRFKWSVTKGRLGGRKAQPSSPAAEDASDGVCTKEMTWAQLRDELHISRKDYLLLFNTSAFVQVRVGRIIFCAGRLCGIITRDTMYCPNTPANTTFLRSVPLLVHDLLTTKAGGGRCKGFELTAFELFLAHFTQRVQKAYRVVSEKTVDLCLNYSKASLNTMINVHNICQAHVNAIDGFLTAIEGIQSTKVDLAELSFKNQVLMCKIRGVLVQLPKANTDHADGPDSERLRPIASQPVLSRKSGKGGDNRGRISSNARPSSFSSSAYMDAVIGHPSGIDGARQTKTRTPGSPPSVLYTGTPIMTLSNSLKHGSAVGPTPVPGLDRSLQFGSGVSVAKPSSSKQRGRQMENSLHPRPLVASLGHKLETLIAPTRGRQKGSSQTVRSSKSGKDAKDGKAGQPGSSRQAQLVHSEELDIDNLVVSPDEISEMLDMYLLQCRAMAVEGRELLEELAHYTHGLQISLSKKRNSILRAGIFSDVLSITANIASVPAALLGMNLASPYAPQAVSQEVAKTEDLQTATHTLFALNETSHSPGPAWTMGLEVFYSTIVVTVVIYAISTIFLSLSWAKYSDIADITVRTDMSGKQMLLAEVEKTSS